MSKVNEIMEKYKAGEITVEEANEQLRQQGANFHLEPMTDEERAAKKQREDELGFIPATEEAKPLPKTPDMRRRKDLAGQVVRQKTRSGPFDVTYDADGYAVKARRVN